MREVLKFTLKGPDATIRKPESNNTYFTYNNVHKIMLLGILGAIIGENGYNYNQFVTEISKSKKKTLPDFYNNLQSIKIGIVPNSEFGVFNKKVQVFNNSVGYASKEKGNNLVVYEQYLENPSWDIYILLDGSEKSKKIKDYLSNNKCEYIPYIGKNEHFADISKVEILNAEKCSKVSGVINSIFTDNKFEYIEDEFDFNMFDDTNNDIKFEYKEIMPTSLDEDIGYTNFKEFIFTNKEINIDNATCIYKVADKYIYFF